MDLGKTPRDNDVLTTFVIGLMRTSRHSSTTHIGIRSTGQKTLYNLYSNCLISDSVRDSNVSINNRQNPSTNGIPYDKESEGNPLYIFGIFLKNGPYLPSSDLIIFRRTV